MAAQTPLVPADPAVTAARVSLQAVLDPGAAGRQDGPTAAADLHELLAMQAELATAIAARVRTVDATGTWQQTGSRALWSWLGRHTQTDTAAPMGDSTAKGWQRLARSLPLRPRVHRALGEARISPRHATVLLGSLEQLDTVVVGTCWNTPDWLEAQEQAFLDLALLTDPVTLQRELSTRLQALAPEPAAREHAEQRAERTASLTPGLAGSWQLTATLDPHSGHVLATALEAFRRTDQTAEDRRTPGQRQADALTGLAQAWLATGSTRRRGVPPQLVVLVPEARLEAHQTLRDRTGAPVTCPDPGGGVRLPDPFTEPLLTRDGRLLPHQDLQQMLTDHGPADTADLTELVPPATYPDGTPVPEATLDELLCTATLTRVVLDQDSAVLDVGRGARVFTHPQWVAAMTSWQWQCATDGCPAPATRLDLHHATWWRDGGRTDQPNCVPLCYGNASCHSRVHDGATLRLRDGRLLDRQGLRTPQQEHSNVWPPPLTARPARQGRLATQAANRLDKLLAPSAA